MLSAQPHCGRTCCQMDPSGCSMLYRWFKLVCAVPWSSIQPFNILRFAGFAWCKACHDDIHLHSKVGCRVEANPFESQFIDDLSWTPHVLSCLTRKVPFRVRGRCTSLFLPPLWATRHSLHPVHHIPRHMVCITTESYLKAVKSCMWQVNPCLVCPRHQCVYSILMLNNIYF